jgi:hypothetical protein
MRRNCLELASRGSDFWIFPRHADFSCFMPI